MRHSLLPAAAAPERRAYRLDLSRGRGLIPALLLALGLALGPVTTAGAADPFTVTGVAVDITAANAAEARDQAIGDAQRKAFTSLYSALTGKPGAPSISTAELARLVSAFEIDSERTSSVRYVGSLTVHFRADRVRSWLGRSGTTIVAEPTAPVTAGAPAATPPAQQAQAGSAGQPGAAGTPAPGSDAAAAPPGTAPGTPAPGTTPPGTAPATPPAAETKAPTLVLAVANDGGRPVLWEDRTPWRAAWEEHSPAPGEPPLILPLGDLADLSDINAGDALAGTAAALAKIAKRYQAGEVVVARLTESSTGTVVTLARYDREGLPLAALPPLAVAPGATPAEVTRKAAAAALAALGGAGTAATPATVTNTDLTVALSFATMADWLELRKRLTTTPGLAGFELHTLARTHAEVVLHFRGDLDRLKAALATRELSLMPPAGAPLSVTGGPGPVGTAYAGPASPPAPLAGGGIWSVRLGGPLPVSGAPGVGLGSPAGVPASVPVGNSSTISAQPLAAPPPATSQTIPPAVPRATP